MLKKCLLSAFLLTVSAFVFCSCLQAAPKTVKEAALPAETRTAVKAAEPGAGAFQTESGNFKFKMSYDKKGNAWIFEVSARTEGWIALGFGQTKIMKDAEIIIGCVKDGKAELSHHFATGFVKHVPLGTLDPAADTDAVTVISGGEKDKTTVIKFSRKASLKGDYYKQFKSGAKMAFIYATGKTDDIKTKHSMRGSGEIIIP